MVCIVHSWSWWSCFCICLHSMSVNPNPTLSPSLTLSLLAPHPLYACSWFSDKDTDVADVDVNSMNSMLLYRGCKTVKIYIRSTYHLYDHVYFQGNKGTEMYKWIKYWKFYQVKSLLLWVIQNALYVLCLSIIIFYSSIRLHIEHSQRNAMRN